jgi:acyl-coenzyme A synthetase/AMP-(fatty) acid ligase/lauroyl/myristoyl acyltransferase/acyl carrier protein
VTGTVAVSPEPGSVDAVLRQLAATLPGEHLLLVDAAQRVTVGEFAAQTERLARLIGAHFNGDTRGRRVALLFRHEAASLIGLHAVLRSGAVAIPLALEQGEAFQRRIADEVNPELWLTTAALLATVHRLVGDALPVLCVDARPAEIAAVDLQPPDPQQTVLLYATSGSTGRPRLVERSAAQLLSHITVFGDLAALDQSARFAHLHLYAFAAGAIGAVVALLSGVTIVFGEAREDSSGELYRLLQTERVTHLVAVLPLMRALSDVAELRGALHDLRVLITGGEKITAADWPRLAGMVGPQAEVLLTYGSTEAVGTAYQRLSFADVDAVQREAALLPLPDCTISVVDERLRPLPLGADGEVLISSPRISSGYYGMPELTAERFVTAADGRRFYRSGDRGRLLPDGRFTISGRADFMVKIRGYRVELEAVEAALAAQPEVLESAVTTREIAGAQQLVAFLVLREGRSLTPILLRRRLEQRLPLYAVPLRYCELPALPRTATHKVDRAALPAALNSRPDGQTAYRAAQNELEQRLAAEWAELLGYDRVGVDDDFFRLGGDSLSLFRVLTRIEREYNVVIRPAQLKQVTIAAIARQITAADQGPRAAAGQRPRQHRRQRRPQLPLLGRILPYRLVHQVLVVICLLPIIRRRWLAQRERVLRRMLPATEQRDAQLTDGLLNNALNRWREAAFADPQVRRRYLQISGTAHLQRSAGRGAVVAALHSGVGWILPTVLEQYDPQFARVTAAGDTDPDAEGSPLRRVRRLKQLLQARQRLEAGGIAMIAADGHHGHGLTTRTVLGRRMKIRPGAAELAAQTGSILVPVFTRLRRDGVLLVEFQPPLQSMAATEEERTAELIEAYADLLATRINAVPQAMDTDWLARLQRYRQA